METFTGRMKWCMAQAMMFVAALCCLGCESIFDDEGDCARHYFARFVYDMNMLRADAFAAQVSSVDLYVFDAETGSYVTHFSDRGDALASGGYRMPLELAPGTYDLVAWCGLAGNDGDFTVPSSLARREDLTCTMARSYDGKGATSNRNLHALYHGTLTAELPDEAGEHTVTVRLTKDTNNINLSLQHTAGPLDPARFEVTMTDDNGLMAYDNSLMADSPVEYRPWSLRSGTVDVAAEEGNSEAGFLIAELSTARLMASHDARINIVDKEQGRVVFSIPLVQWALLLRSANHASMGEQEYLDREDEYNLMVFLGNKDNGNDNPGDDPGEDPGEDPGDDPAKESWMAMSIYINGWRIVNMDGVEF